MDSAPTTPMAKPVSASGMDGAMHALEDGHNDRLDGGGLGTDTGTSFNNGLSRASGLAGGNSSNNESPGSVGGMNRRNSDSADIYGPNVSGISGVTASVDSTPKGPPLARVATKVPGVHMAQYSNVEVLELDAGAHTVMRRVSNGSVNATQLLKLANLDRSKRQKVLDREIGTQFEKIQGGTGKYQGTWVPLESAVELAKQYGVYNMLRPLFEFDMAFRPHTRPPTQLELDERRRELAQQNMNQNHENEQGHHHHHQQHDQHSESASVKAATHQGHQGTPSASAVAAAAAAAAIVPQPIKRSERERERESSDEHGGSNDNINNERNGNKSTKGDGSHSDTDSGKEEGVSTQHSQQSQQHNTLAPPLAAPESTMGTEQDFDDLTTLPPIEPQEGDTVAEVSRELVTELFLSANRGETSPLTDIMSSHGAKEIQPDVPIDDAGHTALHWAAALGMVPLVGDLVRHGANCRRGNRKGESPLVRAVLVTNSSDNHTFGDLLDLLFPCLHLGDTQGRTVLHHIALTAGIPGRSDASRYYLEALLEWVVRWRGSSGVQWLVDELLDAQDSNGDTALNIAARLGSKLIAQQLVDIGAAVELPNRAGLKPTDFGIEASTSSRSENKGEVKNEAGPTAQMSVNGGGPEGRPLFTGSYLSSGNTGPGSSSTLGVSHQADSRTHSRSSSRAPLDGAEKRHELTERTAAAVRELDSRLSRELGNKEQTLNSAHIRLKEANERLEALLAQKKSLEELKAKRDRARDRGIALDKAAEIEINRFDSESAQQFSSLPVLDTSFDADQPFVVSGDEELRRLPPVLLQARIDAYMQNEKQLVQLRDQLRSSSLEGEANYRKVIARGTNIDENKVDDILDDLLTAVIRDGNIVNEKGDETMEVDN